MKEQLDKYLADVHAIEEQALTQLHRAPDIAGDERLTRVFRQHLAETNGKYDPPPAGSSWHRPLDA
jgi:ferritin-like metal-binding protein YciE